MAYCSEITRPASGTHENQTFLVSGDLSRPTSCGCQRALRIAVASNFATQLKSAVTAYQTQSNDRGEISISAGSTGKLFAQIKQGAPFDLFSLRTD